MTKRYTIAVDFDGVLHSYISPWVNAHTISDPPVPGAMEWLNEISLKFDVVIFTTRGKTWRGRRAVRRWLWDHGYSFHLGFSPPKNWTDLDVTVTATKPPALIYLDDRAWRFAGTFPTPDEIHRARPWKAPAPGPEEER